MFTKLMMEKKINGVISSEVVDFLPILFAAYKYMSTIRLNKYYKFILVEFIFK